MSDSGNIAGLSQAPDVARVASREESCLLASENDAPPEVPEELWQEAGSYPCLLSTEVSVERFTVRDLLRLGRGAVLESTTASVDAVPVVVNRQTVGWAVVEVVGQHLAARMTELV